jgi:uncharacterized repeat protein (TIGR03837 family)
MRYLARMPALLWDIYCRVIDNYGDVGVCWRLARGLAASGERVRLWIEDPAILAWMAPSGANGVRVGAIDEAGRERPGDAIVTGFGSQLPTAVMSRLQSPDAGDARVCWVNLEYLSAEAYAAKSHGLASPVTGAGANVRKWFFFPGFTPDTGGLLREADLDQRRRRFDRVQWLAAHGVGGHGETVVSLFCYEPRPLAALLARLASAPHVLLVTAGRAQAAMRAAIGHLPGDWNRASRVTILELPFLPQDTFDEMLWSSDLNLVRGEDSLVRALWAGAPFVWQAYPQDDAVHRAKLDAFLDWLQAPPSLRGWHEIWNGLTDADLPELRLAEWGACARQAEVRLLAQDDLVCRLLRFVRERR